jgi:hypothetical protein
VTYLRGDAYLPLLRQLECSMRRSAPGLELAVLAVEGELGVDVLRATRALNITLLWTQPLDFPNDYEPK